MPHPADKLMNIEVDRFGRGKGITMRHALKITGVVIAVSAVSLLAWAHLRPKDHLSLHSRLTVLQATPRGNHESRPSHGLQKCASNAHPQLPHLLATNIWAPLSPAEIKTVEHWLGGEDLQLNLTEGVNAKPWDNSIFLIETRYPGKGPALAYLDAPTTVQPPPRNARVVIHHGALPTPVVREYVVGPLPPSPETKMSLVTEVPYNVRGIIDRDYIMDNEWVMNTVAPLAEVAKDLFGGQSLIGEDNEPFLIEFNGPASYDGKWRRMWLTWRYNVPGSFLHPVNFYQYVDTSGLDPSAYKLLKIVYYNQIFPSVESFLEAYNNGTLALYPLPQATNESLSWSSRKRVGKARDLDHLPGPRSVSFAGLRYRLDPHQQYVTWMDWKLYLGFDRDMGLNLWDIRFKGERIIYELSPQDAMAQYSAADPFQPRTAWLDRYFGMGMSVREMIPGYDCPQEATYLPSDTYTAAGNVHINRAICIFEHDEGKPITTHVGEVDGESGAVKSYLLTIRSISTVGNYDYLFDYVFYLDGSLEVRVSASGYLQGGFWYPAQEKYGYKIRDKSMGNLHDHVINFKVDLDVAGVQNSLLKTSLSQEEVSLPWYDGDEWGSTLVLQKMEREYVATENDSRFDYGPNGREGFTIANKDALNSWGHPRGYSIRPGPSPVHLTVVGSKMLENNANWAKHNLAVTRRKDSEPSSSSMWNGQLPGAPTVNYDNFFDGESLDQEDLVLWINVGTHHLPHAEDSPNTKTNVATSSFTLTPMNYFDYDVAMDSLNSVFLKTPENPGEPFGYDDNGVKMDFNCIAATPPPFSFVQNQLRQGKK